MSEDQLVVYHFSHLIEGKRFYLLDFTGGPETVKKVEERYP